RCDQFSTNFSSVSGSRTAPSSTNAAGSARQRLRIAAKSMSPMTRLDVLDQPANGVGAAHGLLKVRRVPVEQMNRLRQHHAIGQGRVRHAEIGGKLQDGG